MTAPPPAVAEAAAAVAERYGPSTLATGELASSCRDLAARPDLWEPLIVSDRARRRYRLLFEDRRLDVWVLSWMPGQATGYHDHCASNVALTALRARCSSVSSAPASRASSAGSARSRPAGPGRLHPLGRHRWARPP